MRIGMGIGVVLAAVIVGAPTATMAQTWGYTGETGPSYWGDLSPDWGACGSGAIQSPVDIHKGRLFPKLAIEYGETAGEIFNNGHTNEVEVEEGNSLTLDGVDYDLAQFHFHTPSEHRVNGRGYDMEMHLVHTSAAGTNAVIGVFLTRGATSGALAPIFASLPDDLNVHHPLDDPFDPEDFLPPTRTHHRYLGSLTTPACTEGVQWIVMTDPVTITDEDMAQFATRISFNARPVQRSLPASSNSRLASGE